MSRRAAVREAVEKNSGKSVGFIDGWSSTNDQFMMLQKFCGGLASAFPNTAAVESDFSIIGREKNDRFFS
jgi:hypothetical protein